MVDNNPKSNLPLQTESLDSSDSARKFFNSYYETGTAVPGQVLDAAISFFRGRGFSQSAAESIATVLLTQAKRQHIDVFTLIDTLKTLDGVKLSNIVKEILNYNRLRISTLGTKLDNTDNINYELRNVLP